MPVYKYFPNSRHSFFIKPLLRFTPIKDLNDPFECRSSFKYMCSPRLLDKYFELKKNGKSFFDSNQPITTKFLYRRFPKDIFMHFDSLWNSQSEEISREEIYKANESLAENFGKQNDENSSIDNLGILSFSQNNNNPTMWAHYASNHSGFVISFDPAHEFFEQDLEYEYEKDDDGRVHSIPVKMNKSDMFDIYYQKEWAKEYAFDLGYLGAYWDFISKKSASWKYEKESRMVRYDIHKYNDYDVIGLVDCPVEAIKAVYLGLSVTKLLKEIVKSFCKQHKHIAAYEAYLSNKTYAILFKPITE